MNFRPPPPSLGFWFCTLGLLSGASGQSAAPEVGSPGGFSPSGLLSKAVGLVESEAGLLGLAGGYEVRFGAQGAEFVPVLGEAAAEDQVLGLALWSIHRAGWTAELSRAQPQRLSAAKRATYRRGAGIEEHFEVTPSGLEHSLVLQSRPGGSGDLELNFALSGNLAPYAQAQADGSWLFQGPYGAVSYGGLTAIDAAGQTAAGQVTVAGDWLHWRLPADFLERASFPLTLDPLIATPATLVGSANNDVEADSAFEESSFSGLVVWKRTLSASSRVIRGQRVDFNGNPIGGLLGISSGGDAVSRPRVASFNSLGKFAVTWLNRDLLTLTDTVRAAVLDGATGALETTLTLEGFLGGFLEAPDIACETLGSGTNRVYVAWNRVGTGIYGSYIAPNSGGSYTATGPTLMISAPGASGSSGLISDVSLASNLGAAGRLGVAYLRRSTLLTSNFDAYMAVFNKDLLIQAPETLVFSSTLPELGVEIDGSSTGVDGATWTVAVASDVNGADVHTLRTRVMRLLGGVLSSNPGTPFTTITTLLNGLDNFSVSTRPGKSLLAYESLGLLSAVNLVTLDSYSNSICDPAQFVELVTFDSRPTIASYAATSGAYYNTSGLLLWNNLSSTSGNQQDIRLQTYRLFNDSVPTWTDMGGGCGPGGVLNINQAGVASIGNGYFVPNVSGAAAIAPVAVLNIAAPQAAFPCGACNFLPHETTLIAPMFNGSTGLVLPIPCKASLVGKSVMMQYTVLAPALGPCPSSPDIALSNIALVTIGD
jgi:hypothetical protein